MQIRASALVVCLSMYYRLLIAASPAFDLSSVIVASNVQLGQGRTLQVDMDSAVIQGITAPTFRQCKEGAFQVEFKLDTATAQTLFYNIYYQNETYKFNETMDGNSDTSYLSNFYGSWEDPSVGFKRIAVGQSTVVDYFRIVGNPRNEKKYYGIPMSEYRIDDETVTRKEKVIMDLPEWLEDVRKKALSHGIGLEKQLNLDAIYSISKDRNLGMVNHRWKRNPRMGRYSVLVVVCDSSALASLPVGVKDISVQTSGHYMHPYRYFLSGKGAKLSGVRTILLKDAVHLKCSIDLSKGVFINKAEQQGLGDATFFKEGCDDGENTFRTAQIEQFFTAEERTASISTIPVIRDVQGNDFSVLDYKQAEKSFSSDRLLARISRSTDYPCKTIEYDTEKQALLISNPGNSDTATAVKENVGVKSRVGHTYGKFTAKISFPEQLNKSGLWNGIVNAFWLAFQDKQPWNNRHSSRFGYSEKGVYSADAPKSSQTYYSEIDIELVKTSRYWPRNEYFGGNGPMEDAASNRDIVVSVSNWDLADQDPVNFSGGFCPLTYHGQEFMPFRWKFYHQALSDRYAVANDEIYSRPFYFYQIEWKPTAIIWRIGPSMDSLKVVGYMDKSVTNIPDNQMSMVVSQEFHPSDWWVPIPFRQEYIPFPAKEITGKIFELTVE